MSTLNTNSRYLHPNFVEFAEELLSTMPQGSNLTKVFFVNSGSEANDLAMRLASAFTGGDQWIAVDHAYHGHTAALTPLSTYKLRCLKEHAQKGPTYLLGKDELVKPYPDVHITSAPDVYRGPFTGHQGDSSLGAKYAQEVEDITSKITKSGKKLSAFIAESMLSCGGQIILPDGYLSNVYRHVRAAGGVCIADEVQVGFGRVGTHWWAFEQQGIVPDIVTLGKPIGNGFPLAAVVTTPAIAAAFSNGMPYFNTYGGNPVSCAAGLAVLRTIRTENLMCHAEKVGRLLLDGFRALEKHAEGGQYVGDVRGRGMFVGLELVCSRDTKVPLSRLAKAITRRMRDVHRILVATDGPYENVIKMKPPLAFSEDNVATTMEALHECLVTLSPEAAKWAARELVAATGSTVPPSQVQPQGLGMHAFFPGMPEENPTSLPRGFSSSASIASMVSAGSGSAAASAGASVGIKWPALRPPAASRPALPLATSVATADEGMTVHTECDEPE